MKVKNLRKALEGLDDEMVILLRVSDEDGGEQFMCSPSGAIADAGCGDTRGEPSMLWLILACSRSSRERGRNDG